MHLNECISVFLNHVQALCGHLKWPLLNPVEAHVRVLAQQAVGGCVPCPDQLLGLRSSQNLAPFRRFQPAAGHPEHADQLLSHVAAVDPGTNTWVSPP